MELSNWASKKMVDASLGLSAFQLSDVSGTHVALFSDSATDAELRDSDFSNEMTGGGYSRQSITFDLSSEVTGDNYYILSSTLAAVFTAGGSDYDANVKYAAIVNDHVLGQGKVIWWTTTQYLRDINDGDSLTIGAGKAVCKLK